MIIPYDPNQQLTTEQIGFLRNASGAMVTFWGEIHRDVHINVNSIIGLSSFILQVGRIDNLTQQDVKTINERGRFLMAVYNEIDVMCQVSSGFVNVHFGPVNVDQLLEEAITDLWEHWLIIISYDSRPRIKQNLPNKQLTFQADSLMVRKAITRLLVDVIGITSGKVDEIEISVNYDEVWIAIEIIAESAVRYGGPMVFLDDNSPRIFLARTIVELHGGKVELKERKGNKLMIGLTLPISQESVRERAT